MKIPYISFTQAQNKVSWQQAVDALYAAHTLPRPHIQDISLNNAENGFLARAAWINDIGIGIKAESIFPNNFTQGLASSYGAMLVYEPDTGKLRAIIESKAITGIKTAADSVLGARLLARNKGHLLVIGTGNIGHYLSRAYSEIFSEELHTITLWDRDSEKAHNLAEKLNNLPQYVTVADELTQALTQADIISSATMAHHPIIQGKYIKPQAHIDLVGAFTASMREADDTVMQRAVLYVDNKETTTHIGDIAIPVERNLVKVSGDLYDLIKNPTALNVDADGRDLTVFKNGGGAHLDLIIADLLLKNMGK